MRILVQFSGGKDSQAALINTCRKYGAKNVEAVFCDTGWEHPITLQHVEDICSKMGVRLTTLRSKKYKDFVDLAMQRNRFPSTRARFCTVELKVIPMVDYIIEQSESLIVVQGIRAKESSRRAAMLPECSYFKEYFEEDKRGLYAKRKVLEWCKHHDASVLRPVFDWTAQEVIDYILEAGQQPNALYRRGFARVGCFPCIMCRLSEVRLLSRDYFGSRRLIEAENKMRDETERGSSFFPPRYIPKRFCANGAYPTVQEVFDYVNRNDDVPDLFGEEEEEYSCMSLYHGLCE